MQLNVEIKKRHLYLIMAMFVFLAGVVLVIAYGGNQPSVMGHTAEEIEGAIGILEYQVVSNSKACSWACSISVSCPAGWIRTGCGKKSGTMRTDIYPTGERECYVSSSEGVSYTLTAYAICVRII